MNRNILKIIAVASMLIDHIGAYLFPSVTWLRWVGRLAFPIFAYFIAEGMKYTRSRKRYVLLLSIFAILSQVPYGLVFGWLRLNTLFTFLMAILVIYLLETYKKHELVKMVSLIVLASIVLVCDLLNIVDYGLLGVLLIVVFYFVKDKKLSLCLCAACLVLLTLRNCLLGGMNISSLTQIASLVAICLLVLYNGEKGRVNLKYLFYIFYPSHLLVIYLVGLLV